MSVAISVLALLVGGVGVTLAVAARMRADRIRAETAEIIRSHFNVAGAADPGALREVGVVRYDALEEMAGQLSFSVALLNAAGDGLVFTSINGRSETRTYVKMISGGKGLQPLSPEEEQSVRSARLGQLRPDMPAKGGLQHGGRLITTVADMRV